MSAASHHRDHQKRSNKKSSTASAASRQANAKDALQKREKKSRKGVGKAKILDMTAQLDRQYAEVYQNQMGMNALAGQLRPMDSLRKAQGTEESVQNLAEVLGAL